MFKSKTATILAATALIVAVFGSTSLGQAAGRMILPKNSVGAAQIKKNAITGLKVKDRSLLARDFRRGQLPRGPRGLQGAQGAQGAQGLKGDKGDPGPATGPAGGDLTGSYPNPTIAEGAVTPAKLAALPGASATSSTNQNIPSGLSKRIVFNLENYDKDSIVNLDANNGRFNINTTGTYLLVGSIPWSPNAAGRRYISLRTNSIWHVENQVAVSVDSTFQNIAFVTRLNAGGWVELWGLQTSGADVPTNVQGYPPTLSVQWLSP